MKNIIWYLFAGTRGGETRCKIINVLLRKPMNANQLAVHLNLDYKTIQHHIEILEENRLVNSINKGAYGAIYFISSLMKENIVTFGEIWERFGKK